MRDSLSLRKLAAPGDRPTRQKKAHLPASAEMKDRGRRSARGASPPAPQQRKKTSEPKIDDASSHKRTRGGTVTHQSGTSTSRPFSPAPSRRKRGRLINGGLPSSTRTSDKTTGMAGEAGRSSSASQPGRVRQDAPPSGGAAFAPTRPSSSRIREARSSARHVAVPDSSDVSRPGSAATTPAIDAPPAWPFLDQHPQRQTRQRPVDPDKLIKVYVEKSGGGSGGGAGNISSTSYSSRGKNTSAEYGQAVRTLEAFAQGGGNSASAAVANASSKTGRDGATSSRTNPTSSSRRYAARCTSSAASSSRGTSARRTPPVASTTTTAPPAAQVLTSMATATGGGGVAMGGRGTESPKMDNVICPQFRLHNLFGTGNSTTAASETDRGQSGRTSETSLGSRRKRPVRTAAGTSGEGRSMPPPRRSTPAYGGVSETGFLDQTKDALVRSTQIVSGSDYDMDDDDYAFLVKLNGVGSAGEGSKRASGSDRLGEEGWAVSTDLFEGMIERLERQESRARDTKILVEASLRLREEHIDAAECVNQFIREGDAVLNFAAGITQDDSFTGSGRAGGRGGGGGGSSSTAGGLSSGVNTNGNTRDARGSSSRNGGQRHGCGGNSGRQRKKPNGNAQEDDSDSDDGEHQARIMRTRGPVTLTETFALPLLRSFVSSSSSGKGVSNVRGGGAGAQDATTSRRAKGWKGKGKQHTSRSGRDPRGDEEEEEEKDGASVSDKQMLEVFGYWANKREAYGGPMLRCFHPFIMRLWHRMEDPIREAEDQEEGKDPHASPEAFEMLKSFRQDLDKARLVVDCVKRREKLKRSAIRFANAYWKSIDETMDAPRPRAPRSSQPKVAAAPTGPPLLPTSARPSTRMAARATSGRADNGGCGGGGGGAGFSWGGRSRSSGRAAARAARAAVAALATAEAMEEEDDYDPVVQEQEHGRKKEQQEQALPPAKSKGKAAGLAEQEQGWNIFAQLPTREGAAPTPEPAADNVVPPPRQKRKGPKVQRGKKGRGGRERATRSVANPIRGLFVHRGVLPEDVDVDSSKEALIEGRLPYTSGARVKKMEGVREAPQHRRSNSSRKTAVETAGATVVAGEKINERAKRRERFSSAPSAALPQQQPSRRQQSSRQQPSHGRELGSKPVESGEEEDDAEEGQEASVSHGRSSRRGHKPEEVKDARSNTTTKRRKPCSEPEYAEEETKKHDTATKRREATARGSERTKRRRLEESTNLENGALMNDRRQHRARSSSSSSSSSHHPSVSKRFKTRASRSEAAVVVVEDVPSTKVALVVRGSKDNKPTSRPGGRKTRVANKGRNNGAVSSLK